LRESHERASEFLDLVALHHLYIKRNIMTRSALGNHAGLWLMPWHRFYASFSHAKHQRLGHPQMDVPIYHQTLV